MPRLNPDWQEEWEPCDRHEPVLTQFLELGLGLSPLEHQGKGPGKPEHHEEGKGDSVAP